MYHIQIKIGKDEIINLRIRNEYNYREVERKIRKVVDDLKLERKKDLKAYWNKKKLEQRNYSNPCSGIEIIHQSQASFF